jgi:endonuclease/exonuclease/phosphatase (EEP) superfamily protein YafD
VHSGLDAAARAAGLETPVADVAATSQWLDMRLDAIYTRGVTTSAHGVAVAVRASDHLPL